MRGAILREPRGQDTIYTEAGHEASIASQSQAQSASVAEGVERRRAGVLEGEGRVKLFFWLTFWCNWREGRRWMDGFRLAWTGTCTVGSALGFYRVPTCIQYNHSSIPSAPTNSDYL